MKTFEDFYKEHVINEGTNRINKVTELLDKANVQDEKVRSTLLKWARSSNNDDVLNKEARKLISEPWENGEEERKQLLTLMNSDKGKEGYHKNNTLAAAVEKAAKTKNFEVVDKKIEDIENKCTDEEKKAKLTPALNKLKDAIDKVREAASVVAEDPEPLPADEDSEFDKLVQAAIKRAEEADKVIRSINIVYDKESSGVAQVNAKEAAKNIFDDLLRILGRDTSTLLKATDFVKAAARSKGEAKILSSEELTKCYNDAVKDGFSGLDPKEVNTPLFKKSLLVCIGILLLKKHANSPDFTLQGMAQGSGYEKDQVLTEVSKRLSSINIDDKIKQEIGLADISKSDTFIPAVQKYINNIAKGTFSPKTNPEEIKDPKTNPEEIKDPKTNPEEIKEPKAEEDSKAKPEETKTPEEKKAPEGNTNESEKLKRLTSMSTPDEVKEAVKEAFGTEEQPTKIRLKWEEKIESTKSNNDAEDKLSRGETPTPKPNEDVQEEAFKEDVQKLILEKFGQRRITHSFLKTNQDAEHSSKGWEDAKDNLEIVERHFRTSAEKIAQGYTNTTPTREREAIISKLIKLYSNFLLELSKSFYKAKSKLSYGAIGKLGYDIRNDARKTKNKAEAAYKDSRIGRINAQNVKFAQEKANNINIASLEKSENINKDFANTLAYAILHPDKLDEPAKVSGNSNNKKIIDYAINALQNAGIELPPIDGVPILLNELSKKEDLSKKIHEMSARYEDSSNMFILKDDFLKMQNEKDLANIILAIAKNHTGCFTGRASVMTESFKEYYKKFITEEGEPQPDNQVVLNDNQKRIAALIVLVTTDDDTEKRVAASYLATVEKDGTVEDYVKGAESYKKVNSEAVEKYKKLIADANKPQPQPQSNPTPAPVKDPLKNAQNADTNSTVTKTMNIISNNNKQRELNSMSVSTEQPQASVTTAAVGGFTIPERLNKKLIRRRMGNTFFA